MNHQRYTPIHTKINKKKSQNKSENQSNSHVMSRDEQLLHQHNISLSIDQVVYTDAEQFNELIKTCELSQEQLNIAKDIRRRGKNKVAAQICRKRKIDSIDSLKEDITELKEKKKLFKTERDGIESQVKKLTLKFDQLYKDIVSNDMNDAILICLRNLKDQLNLNNQKLSKIFTVEEEEEEEDDEDYEEEFDDEEYDEEESEDSKKSFSSSGYDSKSSSSSIDDKKSKKTRKN